MTINSFERRVTPLNKIELEQLDDGNSIEYEEFPATFDVLGTLLYSLFQDHWQDLGLGHLVDGSVLELEFTTAPQACQIYDGYLTVVAEGWHMHLCIGENWGGPNRNNSQVIRQARQVSRAALYRQLDAQGKPQSWGIQFWNGVGDKMMTIFLPNPFLGEGEDFLPEHQPDLAKLAVYENLRQIYVLGTIDIPYETNPLNRPYLAVCKSTRCNNGRDWRSVYAALRSQLNESGMDVDLISSGCLQVCKMGPIVFYSGDDRDLEHTWYARVTPDVARQIVIQHLGKNQQVTRNLYPGISAIELAMQVR
jgi:(2Fe-2S) ferredoxin